MSDLCVLVKTVRGRRQEEGWNDSLVHTDTSQRQLGNTPVKNNNAFCKFLSQPSCKLSNTIITLSANSIFIVPGKLYLRLTLGGKFASTVLTSSFLSLSFYFPVFVEISTHLSKCLFRGVIPKFHRIRSPCLNPSWDGTSTTEVVFDRVTLWRLTTRCCSK